MAADLPTLKNCSLLGPAEAWGSGKEDSVSIHGKTTGAHLFSQPTFKECNSCLSRNAFSEVTVTLHPGIACLYVCCQPVILQNKP